MNERLCPPLFNTMDLYDKDPKSGFHNLSSTIGSVSILALGMLLYAYLRLSSSSAVSKGTFIAFFILQIIRMILNYREDKSSWNIGFETVFFVVFMSVLLGAYSESLVEHPVLLFATILYRPEYMKVGNRRLAFFLALLIGGAVLPVTCGLVTDPGFTQLLLLMYALLVLCLWIFCTKLGLAVIGRVSVGT